VEEKPFTSFFKPAVERVGRSNISLPRPHHRSVEISFKDDVTGILPRGDYIILIVLQQMGKEQLEACGLNRGRWDI
jgi:hypothetical protein